MRIAEVAPAGIHPTSGVTAVIVHLAEEFAAKGHEVQLWQLSEWPDELDTAWERRLREAGVVTVGAEAARASAIRGDADVVHLHNVFSIENNRLAHLIDGPFVVTTHGGYAPEQLSHHAWRKMLFTYFYERPMLRRAAAIVALTDVERQEVERFAGRSPCVIPNGVAGLPAAHGSDFRAELGIGDASLAVYAGRVDRFHKRLDEVVGGLVDAPTWHVAIMGGDFRSGRTALRELAGRLGVLDRLHVVDERRGVAYSSALASADVFVLLSRWEGQSIALLEALSLGVPAIVSHEVEARTPVASEGAGWVTEPDRFGEALRGVAALDANQRGFFRAAAEAVAARYRWPDAAEAYLRLFAELSGHGA